MPIVACYLARGFGVSRRNIYANMLRPTIRYMLVSGYCEYFDGARVYLLLQPKLADLDMPYFTWTCPGRNTDGRSCIALQNNINDDTDITEIPQHGR